MTLLNRVTDKNDQGSAGQRGLDRFYFQYRGCLSLIFNQQSIADLSAWSCQVAAVVIQPAGSSAVKVHCLVSTSLLHYFRHLRDGRSAGSYEQQLMVGGNAKGTARTAAGQNFRIAEAFLFDIQRYFAVHNQTRPYLKGAFNAALLEAVREVRAGNKLGQIIFIINKGCFPVARACFFWPSPLVQSSRMVSCSCYRNKRQRMCR